VRLKRILVPLDGSRRTESVLPAVVRMAHDQGAEILLVHVVLEPLPTALHAAEDMELALKLAGHLESAAKNYLERLRQQLGQDGTSVHAIVVRHPNEREGLLEISRKEEADLIVLSAHGSACASVRPFGSVTTYLLTHSMVPLLALQDLPESECHRIPESDSPRAARFESPAVQLGPGSSKRDARRPGLAHVVQIAVVARALGGATRE
jgi:nucleotide-binding universal stress UspA family protein